MNQPHQPHAAPPTDQQIVRAAIHPAIGVARVGNSQDEYFYGPEVVHPLPEQPGFYKDETGALKRQAALFRVYGYNAAGQVVAELTADNAEIAWTAHVANTKAAWYEFQIALDIPEAATAPPSNLRNADVKGPARAQLVIDPGPRSITGRNEQGQQYAFDSGQFFGTPVYLGELRTDGAGRLVFLGGRGVSASRDGKPAVTFANNDGWTDDTSDGPVTARVRLGGVELPEMIPWGDLGYVARIESALSDLPSVRVRVYEPHGAPETEKIVRSREVPKMTPGRAALVEDGAAGEHDGADLVGARRARQRRGEGIRRAFVRAGEKARRGAGGPADPRHRLRAHRLRG